MKTFKAKKTLGQHFLKNPSVIKKIIDAADPTHDDLVLEIGPGDGILTKELLGFAGKVIAVEKDRRLISVLQKKFAGEITAGKLDLVEKDILEWDEKILSFYRHPYKLVANIPYYITGAILEKFLSSKVQPSCVVLMVQKEIAERIIARSKKESLLSLSVKAYGKPKITAKVPRGNFYPMPKVDSAILSIENISKNNFSSARAEKRFFEILRAGFAHKRKKLIRNLEIVDGTNWKGIFKKEGLPENIRAERVPLETWLRLAN